MATINFEDIEKKFNQAIKDPDLLRSIGDKIIDVVYKRVKAGGGVIDDTNPNTSGTNLERLSDSYIKFRKKNANKLGEFASPSRSNLTFTGQMLNALQSRVENDKVIVFVNDSARSDGKSNRDVANHVRETRPFLALTLGEQRIVQQEIEKQLKIILRDEFK